MGAQAHDQLLPALTHWAITQPQGVALSDDAAAGASATARRLLSWSSLLAAAGAWAQRLEDEDHRAVMICSSNRMEYFVAWLGTLLADAIVFPLAVVAPVAQRDDLARQAGVTLLVSEQAHASTTHLCHVPINEVPLTGDLPAAMALVGKHPRRGSLLLQSSGTTGVSKIVHRHLKALEAVGRNCRDAVGMTLQDSLLVTTALSHSYMTDHALLGAMLAGSTVHLFDRFDPLTLAAAARELRATILPTVPFVVDILNQTAGIDAAHLATLRQVYTAGTALPAPVNERFAQRFGRRVGQIYGSTEFGSVTFNDPADSGVPAFDACSAGLPMQGVRVRIVDRDQPDIRQPLGPRVQGQVAIAAPSMLTGYLHQSSDAHAIDGLSAEGFFLSGDLGFLDEHGRLTLTGRLKLLVDIAGQKVNLMEVEAVLAQYPGVKEVIVVPMAVTSTLNRLKALIVWQDNIPGDIDALRDHARQRLACYQLPRYIEARQSLPHSPTGKILRASVQP